MGNSAVDIAVDVSRTAKKVFMSTRRGAWIISRMGPLGYPADALANSRCEVHSLPNYNTFRHVYVFRKYKMKVGKCTGHGFSHKFSC